jgi:hypothetical protein
LEYIFTLNLPPIPQQVSFEPKWSRNPQNPHPVSARSNVCKSENAIGSTFVPGGGYCVLPKSHNNLTSDYEILESLSNYEWTQHANNKVKHNDQN